MHFFPFILLFLDKLIDSFDDETKKFFHFQSYKSCFVSTDASYTAQFKSHSDDILCLSDAGYVFTVSLLFTGYLKNKYIGNNKERESFCNCRFDCCSNECWCAYDNERNIIKYSMRGEAGIEAKIDKKVADDQPLDYQYATNWSFSPGEVITFLLPYYYGFEMCRYWDRRRISTLGTDAFSRQTRCTSRVITLILLSHRYRIEFQEKSFCAGGWLWLRQCFFSFHSEEIFL